MEALTSLLLSLIFSALAELSTRQIAETDDATGMAENKRAATQGGATAKQARKGLFHGIPPGSRASHITDPFLTQLRERVKSPNRRGLCRATAGTFFARACDIKRGHPG